MKLIKLQNGYIAVADYNTKEDYDSRITKGTPFYKDELKDILIADYSPASKVSRPLVAVTKNLQEYIKKLLGIFNPKILQIGLLDLSVVEKHIANITGEVDVVKLADDYVSNHHDSEVRRMYGHHWRSFIAGTEANKQKKWTDWDMAGFAGYYHGVVTVRPSTTFSQCLDEYKLSLQKTEFDVELEMVEEKLGMLTINPNCWDEHSVMQTGKLKPVIDEDGFVKIKS